MDWQYSVNAAFFGLIRDRFTQYQPPRSVEEKIALVASVEGLSGIELRHPGDFEDVGLVRRALAEHRLTLSAVNVNIKDAALFRDGALSSPRPEARRQAVALLRESMDLAAALDCDLITTCPLADGHDYPFQVDYTSAWDYFIESVRAVASYRLDIRVCLEYQPHEPHARIMLNNVGKMLHVCAQVDHPNLGANLDIGHAFAALESPAEAAALLTAQGRLFYIHTNDNTGDGGDWDMISGSVHFWHWLELLYTLDRVGYTGWLGCDLMPKRVAAVPLFQTNTRMLQRMSDLVHRIGSDRLAALIAVGDPAATLDYLSEQLLVIPSPTGRGLG